MVARLLVSMILFAAPFAILPHPAMLLVGADLAALAANWIITGRAKMPDWG